MNLGILNVSAEDTASGTRSKITITNDQGRLSKEQIEQMVRDAEKYKAEDQAHSDRIKSKNVLENYTYSLRNSLTEQKLKEKLNENELQSLEKAVNDTSKWIDTHNDASKEQYEQKLLDLEKLCNPILAKAYPTGKSNENNNSNNDNKKNNKQETELD